MHRLLVALAALYAASSHAMVIHPTVINGEEVAPGERPDIVVIRTGNSGCTASIAGPRVLITASHCGANNGKTVFTANGKNYEGKFLRSPLYPKQDHDVAVVVATADIDLGSKPYTTVGGSPKAGDKLTIYGFGCTTAGGGGGNDGKLRKGEATITGFSGFDFVSTSGAALCYGDSGGPDYAVDPKDGKSKQVSVNSKGDIAKTNYTARLDTQETAKFLEDVIAQNKVDICGVNKNCDGIVPPKPEAFVVDGRAAKFTVEDKGIHQPGYVRQMTEMLKAFLDGQAPVRQLDIVHPVLELPPEAAPQGQPAVPPIVHPITRHPEQLPQPKIQQLPRVYPQR
jgi:hypothetical protein